jgi:uncharacterized Ntn-hydrolase superfamily protein
MKYYILLFTLLIFPYGKVFSQDTFSIVAADSVTREVGSAGASCVDLFVYTYPDISFLGDLLPDLGAINTQASYDATNQENARKRMLAGDNPEAIINWLKENDVASNNTQRQYGIVGFTGKNVSAAGFTGTNCYNYKNHITGSIGGIYYSIQGNILLGQKVLDSMESRFRSEQGDLACRLMAALQGAKMVGADTRCASNGTSSLFAFVKVSAPTDTYGLPSIKFTVMTHGNDKIEPIDSLQTLFDAEHNCTVGVKNYPQQEGIVISPNPATDYITLEIPPLEKRGLGGVLQSIRIFDVFGNCVLTVETQCIASPQKIDISALSPGMYFVRIGDVVQKFMVVR